MMKQTLAIEKNNDMITISRTEYEALKEQNAELFQQVEWLMEQIRLAKHKRFGASSEKSNEQLTLFNEAEVISDSSVTEPDLEEVRKHYRRKARVSKDRLPLTTCRNCRAFT